MKHSQSDNTPTYRTGASPQHKVTLSCPELPYGRTKQSMKDECNINNIMQKFIATGLVTFVNEHEPQYGDVTGLDFQTAMDTVKTVERMFADLPAEWRKRFNNDPAEFLSFVDDPANRAEGVKLGIFTEPTPDPTTPRRKRASDAPKPPAATA